LSPVADLSLRKRYNIVGKVIDHPVKESPNVETAEENPTSNL
jgi:hypothetical protein